MHQYAMSDPACPASSTRFNSLRTLRSSADAGRQLDQLRFERGQFLLRLAVGTKKPADLIAR